MTKYIKGKDGKFAGSIGDGKNAVPQPAPSVRVFDAGALFGALRANPNEPVRLSDVADAYEKQQNDEASKPAADLYFGGISFAEPREDDTAEEWGNRIAAGIEQEDIQTFSEQFLSSASIFRSGEEYVINVYEDEDGNEATVRYSPSFNIAFVETYLEYDGDFATTEDLAGSYRDAIKNEIASRPAFN